MATDAVSDCQRLMLLVHRTTEEVQMKSILVIDDDRDLRLALTTSLEHRGWQVIVASDGDQGIELARQHLPRAILCDLLMPGKNGFRVCSVIRNDDALKYSLLIAMSGKGFDDTRQAAMEAGADEFMVKPFDFDRLTALLDRFAIDTPSKLLPAVTEPAGNPFVRFWGVRGSIPTPGPETVRYGGNTACVEFRGGGEIVVLDAGTGIRPLGNALAAEFVGKSLSLTILLTHSHWDHVQGFPFFQPAYDPSNRIRVLGFEGTRDSLAGIFSAQMESPFFPIGLAQMPSHLSFEELRSMEFSIGKVQVRAAFTNHPGVCVGYRLEAENTSVAYLPDHEPFHRMRNHSVIPDALKDQTKQFALAEDDKIVRFLQNVDTLILDAQFDADEYARHTGWGHSSIDDAVELALRANARRLVIFHHDPSHDDAKIDQMVQHAQKLVAKSAKKLEIEAGREGLRCNLLVSLGKTY